MQFEILDLKFTFNFIRSIPLNPPIPRSMFFTFNNRQFNNEYKRKIQPD